MCTDVQLILQIYLNFKYGEAIHNLACFSLHNSILCIFLNYMVIVKAQNKRKHLTEDCLHILFINIYLNCSKKKESINYSPEEATHTLVVIVSRSRPVTMSLYQLQVLGLNGLSNCPHSMA